MKRKLRSTRSEKMKNIAQLISMMAVLGLVSCKYTNSRTEVKQLDEGAGNVAKPQLQAEEDELEKALDVSAELKSKKTVKIAIEDVDLMVHAGKLMQKVTNMGLINDLLHDRIAVTDDASKLSNAAKINTLVIAINEKTTSDDVIEMIINNKPENVSLTIETNPNMPLESMGEINKADALLSLETDATESMQSKNVSKDLIKQTAIAAYDLWKGYRVYVEVFSLNSDAATYEKAAKQMNALLDGLNQLALSQDVSPEDEAQALNLVSKHIIIDNSGVVETGYVTDEKKLVVLSGSSLLETDITDLLDHWLVQKVEDTKVETGSEPESI